MKLENKKKPGFEVYSFRLTQEDKAWLEDAIERKYLQLNKEVIQLNKQSVKPKKKVKRNAIILEALKLGLPMVKLKT